MDFIRKRRIDEPHIKNGGINTHFYPYNPQKKGFEIGNKLLMIQIDCPGVPGEVLPVLNYEISRVVQITKISTKVFSQIEEGDFEGAAPYLNRDNLPLILALIYNKTIEEIICGEITRVETTNVDK